MKIIKAKFIILCDDKFSILKNRAVLFDENIRRIIPQDQIYKFGDCEIFDFNDSVLMPHFINTHTHLEYSANQTSLKYGDFLSWVKSVIINRDELTSPKNKTAMKKALESMIKSGVGTIGEISSFGVDLDLFDEFDIRVVFFNEILGSNLAKFDEICQNFTQRFNKSMDKKSDNFIPAISVHSPYSTNPKIAQFALNLAKEQNLIVSTHFLESKDELKWLKNGSGEFKNWLKNFILNPKPFYSPKSYIEQFSGVRTLWTHCVWGKKYLDLLDPNLHFITHCPRSNRLLSKGFLDISKFDVNIGTDGLSSNYNLNFWDELRAGLFVNSEFDLQKLAKKLIISATKNGGAALNLPSGEIKTGNWADFAVYPLIKCDDDDQFALQMILQTKECKKLFIKGKQWSL